MPPDAPRACACNHPYPLCACAEGWRGHELLRRSKWLSSLAGWPGPVTAESAAAARRAVKPRVPLGVRQCAECPPATRSTE